MKRFALLFALCTMLFLGCAYYNTFYNAKKQFKKAEKSLAENPPAAGISGSQRDLYEQAIKKASKVLTFHPKSKYVDDALFMVGKAYFRMEEFGKAQRKFEELLANYPQSGFRWETHYLLGRVHYYMDNLAQAGDVLQILVDAKQRNPWMDDAQFLMGEIAFSNGDYKRAVQDFAKISEDHPKSELGAQAVFMVGECYFKLKNYRAALDAFQKVDERKLTKQMLYEQDLRIGECYLQLKDYQEALKTFQQLARSDRFVDQQMETRLRIAEVYYLQGDTTQAIEEYEDIVKKSSKTKEAAGAYYQLGLISMEGMDDLTTAKDYFDKSKAESPTSDAGKLASLRRGQIDKLEEHLAKVAASDSLLDPEAHIALAEVYLLDLNWPDSALAYYQKVVQLMPQSKQAPLSAYAAAWIMENIVMDTAQSRDMYQDLIAAYPLSESAIAARVHLGQPAMIDTSEQNAAERLRLAENQLLKENDIDGALALYESIVIDFPQSPYAPKAECAIAWTLEYMKGDRDSAKTIFKGLAQKYPNSQCALLAQKKIAAKSAEAPKDTTVQTSTFEEPLEEKEEEEVTQEMEEEEPARGEEEEPVLGEEEREP